MKPARAIAVGVALIALSWTAGAAPAQDTRFQPALIVNERAITTYEIDQRALLLTAFGAPGDVRALAIEQLTDDRLRLQAASQLGLELSEEDLTAAVARFAQQRNLTPEQVGLALQARGIASSTLEAFLSANLLWREVVQARFRSRATPTETDLDAALEFATTGIREELLIQELAIPTEERGQEATKVLADQLSRDLNRGGNFSAAVARYSRAASAARGGRLDWIPAAGLPPQIAGQLLALQPGEVTAAIPLPQGYTVLKLLDIRTRSEPVAATPQQTQQTYVYSQLIIPLAPAAPEEAVTAATARLTLVASQVGVCQDVDDLAEEYGTGSGRSDPTPQAELPEDLRLTLAGLEPNETTVQRDSRGVVLVMLCSRGDATSPEAREALRRRIFNERMNTFGQGFLQELRGDAVIEVR
ncbi:MAG: peptidylprolyl isomerase [Pseudomonadota bacterium]